MNYKLKKIHTSENVSIDINQKKQIIINKYLTKNNTIKAKILELRSQYFENLDKMQYEINKLYDDLNRDIKANNPMNS